MLFLLAIFSFLSNRKCILLPLSCSPHKQYECILPLFGALISVDCFSLFPSASLYFALSPSFATFLRLTTVLLNHRSVLYLQESHVEPASERSVTVQISFFIPTSGVFRISPSAGRDFDQGAPRVDGVISVVAHITPRGTAVVILKVREATFQGESELNAWVVGTDPRARSGFTPASCTPASAPVPDALAGIRRRR